jgi:hypothetical protein
MSFFISGNWLRWRNTEPATTGDAIPRLRHDRELAVRNAPATADTLAVAPVMESAERFEDGSETTLRSLPEPVLHFVRLRHCDPFQPVV